MNNMSTPNNQKRVSYIIAAVCLVAGVAIGIWRPWQEHSPGSSRSGEKPCEYSHINPLRCGDDAPAQVEYSVFKQRLVKELAGLKQKGALSEAAVYFRDLNNGPTFYFNEQAEFAPMSLLKLPVMVAVYKYAESNPKLLEEKRRTPVFGQNSQVMEDGKTLEPDREYTIDEMIRYMIVYSDNRSIDMLTAWLDEKGANHEIIRRTLSDLGMVGYEADLASSAITVKQYASIFRILYNASYLNAEMSEKALSVLEQSEFKDGLTKHLGSEVKVAHKFGIRAFVEGEQQLHDCGIVYHESMPYMMCIMTRGKDYKQLSDYIADTSKEIYDEVDRRSR